MIVIIMRTITTINKVKATKIKIINTLHKAMLLIMVKRMYNLIITISIKTIANLPNRMITIMKELTMK